MTREECRRSRILDKVLSGGMTLKEGSSVMNVSYRQAKRLKSAYEREREAGLVHGNRGKSPWNKVGKDVTEQVVTLSQEKYSKFNDRHFTEKLNRREGIALGREKVRLIRREAGIKPKHRRRPRKHWKRRERKPQRGAMMLWDGSHHAWFGPKHPKACLLASIDDATGMILGAHFEPAETSVGYLRLLAQVTGTHGVPASVYQDRHRALFRADDHWSTDEQIQGHQTPTQVGMVLQDLGIVAIPALSPQAKGRVERLFGTLQDRLVAELDFNGIHDIDTANAWLQEHYIAEYNKRFAIQPQCSQSLFQKLSVTQSKAILSFRYRRVVTNDNTISVKGLVIHIPPGPSRLGYAKAHVDVRQLLDGSWCVFYKNKLIATHESTPLRSPQRGKIKNKARGTHDWVWIYEEAAGD